jgi:hypothetical protein
VNPEDESTVVRLAAGVNATGLTCRGSQFALLARRTKLRACQRVKRSRSGIAKINHYIHQHLQLQLHILTGQPTCDAKCNK